MNKLKINKKVVSPLKNLPNLEDYLDRNKLKMPKKKTKKVFLNLAYNKNKIMKIRNWTLMHLFPLLGML